MVVLAAGIGVGILQRGGDDGDPAPTAPTTSTTADPLPATLGACPRSPVEIDGVSEAGAAATDLVVESPATDQTTAVVRWTDTNAGKALYTVLLVCGDRASQPVAQVNPGEEPQAVVIDLEQTADYCFRVLTIGSTGEQALATTADGGTTACLGS